MIIIDPKSRQTELSMDHVGDFVYDRKNTSSAIAEEAVPVIGPWTDYTGSGGPDSFVQQTQAGTENELWGTDASIAGAKESKTDVTGNRVATTRRRIKKIYVKIEDGKPNFENA